MYQGSTRHQWHVERQNEPDDEHGRQDERARDDERGPGMEAVVSADGDAKARCQGGEGQEQRERRPVGSGRRGADRRNDRGAERGSGDESGVGGRVPGQPSGTLRLPSRTLADCWGVGLSHFPSKLLCKSPLCGNY